jgi:hypothetical protein
MLARLLLLATLCLLSLTAFAQVEEELVDFRISPKILQAGQIHVGFEWLTAPEFRTRQLAVMDRPRISQMNPHNLQLVASKVALISQQSFDELTYERMNQADYIQDMLGAIAIDPLTANTWYLTNRVKAYKLPFRLGYELQALEVSPEELPRELTTWLRREGAEFAGTGRERFISLDMSRFTQLIYRNYSVIYIKELPNGKPLIISGVIAGININRANFFFNYPPLSRTENKMMNNMREQVLQMAFKIQAPARR